MQLSTLSLVSISVLAAPNLQDQVGEPGGAQNGGGPERTVLPDAGVELALVDGGGWPALEVWIESQGPYRMILDTGAGGLILDAELARALELPVVGNTTIGDPSDPSANAVELVSVELLELGEARFEGIEAVSWDRPPELRRPGIDGIVGWPVFEDCLLTLDLSGGRARLDPGSLGEPDGERILAYEEDAFGAITLAIDVAGISMPAHLDSGNPSSVVVPEAFRERLPFVPGTERKGVGRRASGPIEFTAVQLDGVVRVGGLRLERPEIRLDPKLGHANLGRAFLERCVVTLDQTHERIRVVPIETGAREG